LIRFKSAFAGNEGVVVDDVVVVVVVVVFAAVVVGARVVVAGAVVSSCTRSVVKMNSPREPGITSQTAPIQVRRRLTNEFCCPGCSAGNVA
jgi:hypothetical protein